MTKSEMLRQLTGHLIELEGMKLTYGSKADAILEFLENKGMLPPLYSEEDGNSTEIDDYFWEKE